MGVHCSVLSHKTGICMGQKYLFDFDKVKKTFSFKASHIKISFYLN